MRQLTDAVVGRLQEAVDWPDLSDTKYELGERIASGGMGTVYSATDRALSRQVAIKVLRDPSGAPEIKARLIREAEIIAQLEHPGIVPVHDVGSLPDGRVYYVMKLVRGDRLDAYAKGRGTVELLRVFQRICEAVGFAHARGVIHRDLKPENVMVGPFGEVLVMDWGVAKILDELEPGPPSPPLASAPPEAGQTAAGTVLGTPGYMAPEQAQGEVDRVDRRTDVFALGSLLGSLLSGRSPSVASASLSDAPRPLEAICRRARAPDPEDRYQTVEDLNIDVGRYLDGLSVKAYREGLVDRMRRVARKYQTAILLVVAYLLLRVLLLLWPPG